MAVGEIIQFTPNHRLYIHRLCFAYAVRLWGYHNNQRLLRGGTSLRQCNLLKLFHDLSWAAQVCPFSVVYIK